jgi:hypothetical protein
VLPFGQFVSWDFFTDLTVLPPLNTLNVAISNGTLDCPSVQFAPDVSIEQNSAAQVNVYPNPVNTSLHVDAPSGTIANAVLMDLTGKPVLRVNGPVISTIDVSPLTAGSYILELNNGPVRYRKLVIE